MVPGGPRVEGARGGTATSGRGVVTPRERRTSAGTGTAPAVHADEVEPAARAVRSPWWGRSGILVAGGASVGVVVTTALRFSSALQEIRFGTVTLAGLSGLLTLGLAAVMLAGAAWARRFDAPGASWWALAALVPVALVVQYAFPTIVGLVAPDRPGAGARVTVLAQNMWYESTDVEDQVESLLRRDADVYVLSEFTPGALEAFRENGLDRRLPYNVLRPRPGRLGMAVLSRIPFVPRAVERYRIELDLTPPGAAPVHLIASHSPAPTRVGIGAWHRELSVLARRAAHAGPNTVVVGDLNATAGQVAFRELASTGDLSDAQDVGGGGFAATWNLKSRLPPLLRLDHVLVGSGIGVDGFELAPRIGSDHRGIEATIVTRRARST